MRVVEYGCTDNSKLDTKDQKSFLTSLFEIALFMLIFIEINMWCKTSGLKNDSNSLSNDQHLYLHTPGTCVWGGQRSRKGGGQK